MSDLIRSGLTRGRLAALSLTAGSALAVAVPTAAAPPPQTVAITFVFASPVSVLPDKAMLFTTWVTPLGRREDLPGGKTELQLRNSPLTYTLDTKTKQATSAPTTDADPLTFPNPDQLWRRGTVGKVVTSHQTFLGYRCLVRKGNISIGGTLVPTETWVTAVAGRRVLLKSRFGSGDSLLFIEAVSVRVLPTVPPGLLDVPAGYTLTAQKGTP